jgi:hypothetical protein
MLPHSVITISIMTALLPRMSRAAADEDLRKVGAFVSDGMRLVAVLIAPAAVSLLVAGPDDRHGDLRVRGRRRRSLHLRGSGHHGVRHRAAAVLAVLRAAARLVLPRGHPYTRSS